MPAHGESPSTSDTAQVISDAAVASSTTTGTTARRSATSPGRRTSGSRPSSTITRARPSSSAGSWTRRSTTCSPRWSRPSRRPATTRRPGCRRWSGVRPAPVRVAHGQRDRHFGDAQPRAAPARRAGLQARPRARAVRLGDRRRRRIRRVRLRRPGGDRARRARDVLAVSGWYRDDGPMAPDEVAERHVGMALRVVGRTSSRRRPDQDRCRRRRAGRSRHAAARNDARLTPNGGEQPESPIAARRRTHRRAGAGALPPSSPPYAQPNLARRSGARPPRRIASASSCSASSDEIFIPSRPARSRASSSGSPGKTIGASSVPWARRPARSSSMPAA